MNETIIFPSPNWFQVSVLTATPDRWLIYGGPTKILCVLEPLTSEYKGVLDDDQRFNAHIVRRAHNNRIVCVDYHPEWPEKRHILTGCIDGTVKEWAIQRKGGTYKVEYIHGHEAHFKENEQVAGLGYSSSTTAVTVGSFGNIIKWDLKTNAMKLFPHFMKNFRPTCVSCSPHIPNHVAIGTKQGVLFVLDLQSKAKILYKVRGQDDEIVQVNWCPQYEVIVKKFLDESKRRWSAKERMDKIRNEAEAETTVTDAERTVAEDLASAVDKNLPDDSFDTSVVQEDDMFDIYKDHEADEFGHKKYEPEDIYVKVQDDTKKDDFLAECEKLKADILKNKVESEQSMESLVDAMDKAKVDDSEATADVSEASSSNVKEETLQNDPYTSSHVHRHMFASIGKLGGVRIWSKTGKLVATCVVPMMKKDIKNNKNSTTNHPTLRWHTPDALMISDGKSQLLMCNPLKIDCKNKLECRVVHSFHKRGLFCIACEAPRVQKDAGAGGAAPARAGGAAPAWGVWTAAQDRLLVRYELRARRMTSLHTAGGFIYDIKQCPYDSSKIAICVGDGAIRVWEALPSGEDDSRLASGAVSSHWQNVQGKVLTAAWHPERENLLAFSTAEARIGLLDCGARGRGAAVLGGGGAGGVYSLSWGGGRLWAAAGGRVLSFAGDAPHAAPAARAVAVEGQPWAVTSVEWAARGLLVGSELGAVALLRPADFSLVAAAFLYTNIIHMTEWHPRHVSTSQEESPFKNTIAVCAVDRRNDIVLLDLIDKEDGGAELVPRARLAGHAALVFKVAWSPHHHGRLLSTSKDTTTRVWEAGGGQCVAVFAGGGGAALSGSFLSPTTALSGAADGTLRLWTVDEHPPDNYTASVPPTKRKSEKRRINNKNVANEEKAEEEEEEEVRREAMFVSELRLKPSHKFLFPVLHRQMHRAAGARRTLRRHLQRAAPRDLRDVLRGERDVDTDYFKVFGSTNELNEVVAMELSNHERSNVEAAVVLQLFRGEVAAAVQYAARKNLLDPFILSIAPAVSTKFWKETTQQYLTQIDRLVAKGDSEKLDLSRKYGGAIFRKVSGLLALHDVTAAVNTLQDGNLFLEAYVLCRLRHMDSVAQQTLHRWSETNYALGNPMVSAVCFIALGDISKAATVLRRCSDQESLSLAAELAKAAGHSTFAHHIEMKARDVAERETKDDPEPELEELPNRIDLLLKEHEMEDTSESSDSNVDEE